MPDAARLVAAVSLAIIAWIVSGLIPPLMPEGTDFGYFAFVNVGLGILCGWLVMGRRAGRGITAAINNGLTATELGLSFLLPRAIGSSRAFELMLSGRDIDADEAAAIGLVSRVVPDEHLLAEALDLADQINGWSTQGTALTKRAMWAGLEVGSLRAAIEMESHTQLFVRLTTQNFEEAVRARRDGRPPDFKD